MKLAVRTFESDPAEYLRLREVCAIDWSQDAIRFKALEAYHRAEFAGQQIDVSAAVVAGGKALVVADANITNGILGMHCRQAEIGVVKNADANLLPTAIRLLVNYLVERGKANGATRILVHDSQQMGQLSLLGQELLRADADPSVQIRAVADLALSEEELHGDIRKSFRNCVNWGRKNLTIAYVNASEPDLARYRLYQNLHLQVSGRVTRSLESWNRMFEIITSGGGELILGYLDGVLVAGCISTYTGDTATYGSGVYDRNLFDRPIGHWPVFLSLLRARKAGLKYFDVGEIPSRNSVTAKEYSIGYFKRGFTSRFSNRMFWQIRLDQPRDAEPEAFAGAQFAGAVSSV